MKQRIELCRPRHKKRSFTIKQVRQLRKYLELLIKKKLKQQISDIVTTPCKLVLASLRIGLLKPFLVGTKKNKLGLV